MALEFVLLTDKAVVFFLIDLVSVGSTFKEFSKEGPDVDAEPLESFSPSDCNICCSCGLEIGGNEDGDGRGGIDSKYASSCFSKSEIFLASLE